MITDCLFPTGSLTGVPGRFQGRPRAAAPKCFPAGVRRTHTPSAPAINHTPYCCGGTRDFITAGHTRRPARARWKPTVVSPITAHSGSPFAFLPIPTYTNLHGKRITRFYILARKRLILKNLPLRINVRMHFFFFLIEHDIYPGTLFL